MVWGAGINQYLALLSVVWLNVFQISIEKKLYPQKLYSSFSSAVGFTDTNDRNMGE